MPFSIVKDRKIYERDPINNLLPSTLRINSKDSDFDYAFKVGARSLIMAIMHHNKLNKSQEQRDKNSEYGKAKFHYLKVKEIINYLLKLDTNKFQKNKISRLSFNYKKNFDKFSKET